MLSNTAELNDCLIVIPARLASTRLPAKPLQDLGGLPLILRVAQNARVLSDHGAHIVVATDAQQVLNVCKQAGVDVVMTDPQHESGTDRCWEVAQSFKQNFIVNLQGDEPFLDTSDVLHLVRELKRCKQAALATLVVPRSDPAAYRNPNVVKAIANLENFALYFTRASAPHYRDVADDREVTFLHHQGVYAYRRDYLEEFCKLEPSPLEKIERLEQLRALENGMKILLVESQHVSAGIDTPEDLEAARARFA